MPQDATRNRRRWFRFSLQTMFVVVTMLAIFIAYHVNWIRQRHAVLIEFFGSVQDPYEIPHDLFELPDSATLIERVQYKWNLPDGPGLLWLFGERARPHMIFHFMSQSGRIRELTRAEQSKVESIRRLFPEANVTAEALDPRLSLIPTPPVSPPSPPALWRRPP